MEHGHPISAGSGGHEHEAKLAYRGVGQHTFNIGLHHGDGRGHDSGDRANPGDGGAHFRRQRIDSAGPRNHVNTGRHHGCGMDQSGNRSGTFHRIRQPHEQWQLRRFAGCAQEQQCGGGCQKRARG